MLFLKRISNEAWSHDSRKIDPIEGTSNKFSEDFRTRRQFGGDFTLYQDNPRTKTIKYSNYAILLEIC